MDAYLIPPPMLGEPPVVVVCLDGYTCHQLSLHDAASLSARLHDLVQQGLATS